MILITGATGNLGSSIIENLLNQIPAKNISALCRDQEKAKLLAEKGITLHIGDYNDKPSLVKAFKNVDKLLLISSSGNNPLQEHKNVIDTAKEVGVKHIYYTSGALNRNVRESKLGCLADSYFITEDYIKESGLIYTIFQNGLYAETIPYFIGENALQIGIYFPAGAGKASFAKRDEMAEAIANVLASDGHDDKTYVTSALPSYSFIEIAQILSNLTSKQVQYDSPTPTAYEEKLKSYGLSDEDIWYSSLLAAIIKNHEYYVDNGSDLENLLGRKPTDLKTYLKDTYSL